jgi:hypothetical protein
MIQIPKQKSVEKSVRLSVERNGISVEQHINAMNDILDNGLPAFIEHMQALQGKHITKQESDAHISKAEPTMGSDIADLCDDLYTQFRRGNDNA